MLLINIEINKLFYKIIIIKMVSAEFFREYYKIRLENPKFSEEDIDTEFYRIYRKNIKMMNDHDLFRF